MPKFVEVETPYAADTEEGLKRNLLYARACVKDCVLRGEIPFASHLFFTQPGILDDTKFIERGLGILAGKRLTDHLPDIKTVVYQDLGISEGMKGGVEHAERRGRKIEYRRLDSNWEAEELKIAVGSACKL